MLLLKLLAFSCILITSVFSTSVKARIPQYKNNSSSSLVGRSAHKTHAFFDRLILDNENLEDTIFELKEEPKTQIFGRQLISPMLSSDEKDKPKKDDRLDSDKPLSDVPPLKPHNGSPQVQATPMAMPKEDWTLLSEDGNTTVHIDKAHYEGLEKGNREKINLEVSNLQTFYKKEILSKIPADISKSLKDYKIQFYFKKNIYPRGQFQKEIFIQEMGEGKKEKVVKVWIDAGLFFDSNLNRLLAHEFFHVVHFIQNPKEEDWVQEGLAQVFEFIVLGKLNGLNFQAAFESSGTPIIGAYDPKKINRAQYGHNMLYFYYLYKHCGEEKLFWELSRPHVVKAKEEKILVGDAQITESLRVVGAAKIGDECKNFQQSAISYELARRHNKKIFSSDYKEVSLRYFLFPTGQKAAILEAKNLSEAQKILGEAPLYSPIRVSARLFEDVQNKCKTCQQFYLQNRSPYQVIEGGTESAKTIDKDEFDSVMVNLK